MFFLPYRVKLPRWTRLFIVGFIFFYGSYNFQQSASGFQSQMDNCNDLTCIYFLTTKVHHDHVYAVAAFMVAVSCFVLGYFEYQDTIKEFKKPSLRNL
jgi:hypothetical protein